jgi:hypothetical protein
LKVFRDLVVKKPKYSTQNLTDEDKEILYQVVFKYATLFYNLTQKYASPKEYAEKEILKIIQSDKDIATLYTLIYAKNYPHDYLYKPGEINQKLANDMRNSIQQDYRDMTTQTDADDEQHKRFLHPRDLREKVLKNLESYGIILHLEGKDKIRQHQREVRRPGKKSLSDDDRGGKPSAYIVTEKVEKLKKAMEKPQALDFLYDKVIKSGIAHQLAKFNFSAFLYAAKMDERVIYKLMGAEASLFQDTITDKDIGNFKVTLQQLQGVDDDQLEQLADHMAKSAIEDRKYYALLFLAGLLKLKL